MDIQKLSALEIGQQIADRKISAPEVTQAVLDRIATYDSRHYAYITVAAKQAMAQAVVVQNRLDAGEKLSPLAGVPMAVKDNLNAKGLRTTCASKMLWDYVSPYNATAVERLLDGGAVLLGKTNLDEFAMGNTTESSFGGITKNPWDISRVPGGSSGGSAAAVAAGEAVYALGSDTGGSIRQPASFCGVTGLKPTYGAVSRFGLIAYASSLDQIGPIARTAADCGAILAQIAGPDGRDSTAMPQGRTLDTQALMAAALAGLATTTATTAQPLKGLKVGIPAEYFGEGLQNDVRLAIEAVAATLTQLGATCETCHLPLVEEGIATYYLIATAEASANLARYDGIQYGFRPTGQTYEDLAAFYAAARTEGFGPEVRRRIMLGTFALSSGYYDAYYLKALKVRKLLQQGYRQALAQYDVLLGPVAPTTAPKIGTTLADPLQGYLADIYTVAANLTGLPGLAIPCGFDPNGLPIGCQLIGRAFDEATLVKVGSAFQNVTDFHRQSPAL
ncbi:MAG: Asp-tRNA(Asn)/Glu-tRNA(Gln) amidotransferase subunit GatA [Eubacteriales bacterium]|nr:Asp-tRNA(Asn)/Glu-tRNA(Gln) amidotransferase subunit GatA [Eubacteriales bacterium]